jgi:ArsR family transcriptional regulator, arsenate/arsenite/antimonite-responsive transcriptional repressor
MAARKRNGKPAGRTNRKVDEDALALMCKALAHPARVKLLNYLADYGTCYFGNLTDIVPLAASTISQHVMILKEAGLIEAAADGQRVCYCVKPKRLQQMKAMIADL